MNRFLNFLSLNNMFIKGNECLTTTTLINYTKERSRLAVEMMLNLGHDFKSPSDCLFSSSNSESDNTTCNWVMTKNGGRDVEIYTAKGEFFCKTCQDDMKFSDSIKSLTSFKHFYSKCTPDFQKVVLKLKNFNVTFFHGPKASVPCACVKDQQKKAEREELVRNNMHIKPKALYEKYGHLFKNKQHVINLRAKAKKQMEQVEIIF